MLKVATHTVTVTLPQWSVEVEGAGITFVVREEDVILGYLTVRRGVIEWLTSPKQKARKRTWRQFKTFMEAPK